MKILFLHRNFPAQFRHIITELVKSPENRVVFVTNRESEVNIQGATKFVYKLKREIPKNCHSYLKFYEESIIHAQACAEKVLELKNKGFVPDVIFGHTWGNTMFIKDIFPNVPLICYFEWFYNAEGADVGFDGNLPNIDKKAKIRCKNSHLLVDLYSCDAGISPTQWQKNQFPKEFHHKISVMHDGIDTNFFAPKEDVKFKIPNSDLEFSRNDEIITYATRGMEPYRGFPEFMKAAEILLKRRPNAHVIIAGEDRVCYGAKLANGTFKELMLKNLDLDLSRVHFTGGLPYIEYLKLLQVSSAHVYLTYPFVLSWSMLEAMATGCLLIASKTQPVEEVVKDGENGLLVDFYSPEQIVNTIEDIFTKPDKINYLRTNARQTIIDNYEIKNALSNQINLINSLINR